MGILPTTYAGRLEVLQSFKETIWGTGGQATARWMGLAPFPQFKPYVKSVLYDEDRGSLQNDFVSNVLQRGGEYTVNWQYASYEDINFALQNFLQYVAPTGGNPYVYAYAAPTTAVNALQPFTLEHGYDILTGTYGGCIGNKLMIKGESKKQWEAQLGGFYKSYTINAAQNIVSSTNTAPIVVTVTAHGYITGDQVVIAGHLTDTAANGIWTIIKLSADTFSLTGSTGNGIGGATGTVAKAQTPAIADRTVEAILFPGMTLKIEAAAGTLGTTSYPNTLLHFQLDMANNVLPIWTGDALGPSVYAYDRLTPTLGLRLVENAQVKALMASLEAGNRVIVQLKQTSGAKVAEIDFAGVLADDPAHYGHDSGAAIIEIKLEGQYDSGAFANSLKVVITNAVSTIP